MIIPIIIITCIIILLINVLNQDTRYEKISISQEKWNNIISSRDSSKDLVLEKIRFNDYSLCIDENSSKIYYSIVNNNKTKYNPNVGFKANEDNVKLAVLLDEITDEKVFSNYEFKIMIYSNSEYHIYNLVCIGFPTLSITYGEGVKIGKEKNIPIEIYLFNNLSDVTNRITKSSGKLDLINNMGNKEYKFSLQKTSLGRNKRENPLSIFNMKPNDDYILKAINVNKEENKSNKAQPVELFINGSYMGVYSLEHF